MISSLSRLLPEHEHSVLAKSLTEYPPRAIRLRPSKASQPTPMATRPVPWFPRGRIVESSNDRPSQFVEYVTGDYYIQDAGSMLALALLDARPGEAICDLCAAPGGKASSILESLSEVDPENLEGLNLDRGFHGGWLLANEPIRTRMAILEYALARTGHLRFMTMNQDPSQVALRFPARFDAVVVDAPCSGQALVANDKHDENAFDPRLIEHSAARQRRILMEAIRLLKPGGRLIYSTCTFAIEENESQIDFLLESFPGAWQPIQPKSLMPWASPITEGCYRVWPHRDPTAGAFAAGLRLIGDLGLENPIEVTRSTKELNVRQRKHDQRDNRPRGNLDRLKKFPSIKSKVGDSGSSEEVQLLQKFGVQGRLQMKLSEDRLSALSEDIQVDQAILECRWPELLQGVAGRWEPQHALAIARVEYFKPHRTIDLNEQLLRSYLVGQSIVKFNVGASPTSKPDPTATEASQTPWCVATCRGEPIGWMKDAGNRFNNHLVKIGYQNLNVT
jgi:16S rRNA C967 or C1407 C5-methylase (RsmB/RsmF family)